MNRGLTAIVVSLPVDASGDAVPVQGPGITTLYSNVMDVTIEQAEKERRRYGGQSH